MTTIHVSFCVDAGFATPLWVAIASLARAHSPGECAVTVLYQGLDDDFRSTLSAEVAHRITVTWVEVDEELVAGAHYSTFLSRASLYRLLLPALLPTTVERTIYLDADIIVMGNLSSLWQLDMNGCLVGAVREAAAPWPAGPCGTDWLGLGMRPDSPYFNSGVLVISLRDWREQGIAQQVLGVLTSQRPRWGDQDGLNAVLEGRWFELGRQWNLQTADAERRGIAWALWRDDVEAAVASPSVIHYTERHKPWDSPGSHSLEGAWLAVLDGTSRRGWRPLARPRRGVRVGRRIKAAVRALIQDDDP